MIAWIKNRPVIDVGGYQVAVYDRQWLCDALKRAAQAADHGDFPFVEEVCEGIFQYLENGCSLKLLSLADLYAKMAAMLRRIDCERIAAHLVIMGPPVSVCLLSLAERTSLELAFLQQLRQELLRLKAGGAVQVRLERGAAAVRVACGAVVWSRCCELLLREVRVLLLAFDPSFELPTDRDGAWDLRLLQPLKSEEPAPSHEEFEVNENSA